MAKNKLMSLTLAATMAAIGLLLLTSRAAAPKEPTLNDILSEAEAGSYEVINAEDLWERYQKEPETILLVDTRQDWEYRAGYIKNALHFAIEPTWWSRWRKQGELKELLGADKNRFIVFY